LLVLFWLEQLFFLLELVLEPQRRQQQLEQLQGQQLVQ
jgi:hypothetical protein